MFDVNVFHITKMGSVSFLCKVLCECFLHYFTKVNKNNVLCDFNLCDDCSATDIFAVNDTESCSKHVFG
ncbi:hypothetical protein DA792_09510 [Celeribacter baekdonensis]|uniref:Uncharacterized protein n=1 Tax=Celeribacter baekdonensis TaxID=875171 RepID=A0A2R4M291_9RHOB|nr:hypothetical protein DA792_09510 [Celeribacter baekdonensis]